MVSCQLPLYMAEEIAFKNGQISNCKGLVTLTLDRVILHTVVHHSSTSTYMPNFIKIEEAFCVRMDARTDRFADGHLRPAILGRLCSYVPTSVSDTMTTTLQPTNSIEAQKGIQGTDPTQWPGPSFFIDHWTPDRRHIAPFTPALWRQYILS